MGPAATTTQLDPFHSSVRASTAPPLSSVVKPTVQHSDADTHETPSRIPPATPTGSGLGTTDQAEPSQCSVRVPKAEPLPGGVRVPTAQQSDASTQVTLNSA